MSCDLCRIRPEAVIVKTGEGEAKFCEDCYRQYRLLTESNAADGIFDFFERYAFDDYNPITAYMQRKGKICPDCGWSIDDVIEGYKFGCAKCYDHFSDKAQEYFAKLGGKEYRGKYSGYENNGRGRRLSEMTIEDIPFLKKALQDAKERGETAKAGAIEKRIDQLKGGR